MTAGLGTLIVLVIFSGLFSAAEIALTALTTAKVKALEGDGKFGSKSILKLKEKPQRLLVSILVGNQAINIFATVVATVWGIAAFGEERIGLVTLVFTLVLILFGSIAPKTIALRFPEQLARALAYPLLWFIIIARPVMWAFEGFTKGVLWALRADKHELPSTSQAELAAILDISAAEGVLQEEEEAYMKHVLQFGETKVEEIMTILKDIKAIPMTSSRKQLSELLMEHKLSRLPVYGDDLNDIKGVVHWHEMVELIHLKKKKEPLKKFSFPRLIVVPRTTSITELLKEFKDKKHQMSIVVDEHGQTVGIVTLEDILEEIAGTTIEPKRKEATQIEKIGKNQWVAKGETTVGEIEKELGVKIGYPEHRIISLVIMEFLKRFPEPDEKIRLNGVTIEIKSIDRKSIKSVLIHKSRTTEKGENSKPHKK